jgi:hypothetical protein
MILNRMVAKIDEQQTRGGWTDLQTVTHNQKCPQKRSLEMVKCSSTTGHGQFKFGSGQNSI